MGNQQPNHPTTAVKVNFQHFRPVRIPVANRVPGEILDARYLEIEI
jgi:hypothetical protein